MKYRRTSRTSSTVGVIVVLWFSVFVACAYGYTANIIQLASMTSSEFSVLLALKIVGIFALPLGVILGYV